MLCKGIIYAPAGNRTRTDALGRHNHTTRSPAPNYSNNKSFKNVTLKAIYEKEH